MASKRVKVPPDVQLAVLVEAGYRSAVPTCRTILAIDLHHMEQVSEGGGNDLANLIALCPTCHALFHRGIISRDAIYAYKGMLVALNHAFDEATIDGLLFLYGLQPVMRTARVEDFVLPRRGLLVSGDGVLRFSRLIGSGLATFELVLFVGPTTSYKVELTPKGRMLVEAWMEGKRAALRRALAGATDEDVAEDDDNTTPAQRSTDGDD